MAFGGSIGVMSDEIFDPIFRVCKRKGRNQEADKYCVECQDYFCLICVKVHEDIPALTRHKILDKDQFSSGSSKRLSKGPQGTSQGQPSAPTEKCDRHNHYIIDTYCQNHDDVGCATCMALDHRSCKDIFYIPEYIRNNEHKSAHRDSKYKLDSIASSLKVCREGLQKEKCQLSKRKDEVLENVKRFRKEINERLDELEKSSVANIEDKFKTLISKIDEGIRMLDANTADVKTAQDKVRSTGSNISQDFVNAMKGKNIASIAFQCLEHNKACIQTADIGFSPDQKILALLREISMLGKTTQINRESTEINTTSNFPCQMKINQSYRATGIDRQKDALLQAEEGKEISVKVESDKCDCDIDSACTLDDGTIVLSDIKNKKLKRFDSSTYTVTDYCDLPGGPWQVCHISKQEVAVCLGSKQVVQFVSVGSRMTITNQIKTDFACCGLAYAAGNLYISDLHTAVYIHSVSGSMLKQYSKDQTGHRLFSYIYSLAVSKDGSNIYVSDFYKGLIVLDKNGQVVGQFNGRKLKGASGCYLTDTRCLLVCGSYSHNVLQFGLNGELRNQLLEFTDKNVSHQTICCNQQMTKMIIGRTRNEIEVYDIVKRIT